jgi:hypothetical protein
VRRQARGHDAQRFGVLLDVIALPEGLPPTRERDRAQGGKDWLYGADAVEPALNTLDVFHLPVCP